MFANAAKERKKEKGDREEPCVCVFSFWFWFYTFLYIFTSSPTATTALSSLSFCSSLFSNGAGTAKFVLEAPAPDWGKLPPNEIRGVTVVLVTCSYNTAEFVRIGYYVNNDFQAPELRETPPDQFVPATMVPQLQRHILAEKPRVTRYTIPWDQPVAPTGFGMAAAAGGGAVAAAPAAAGGGGGMDMDEDDNLAMPIAAGGGM